MKIPTTWNKDCSSVCTTSATTSDNKRPCCTRTPTVSFASQETVYEIPTRQSYTTEEMEASFYTASDYKAFKKASLVILKENRAGTLDTSIDTMRGLECRTREGAKERKDIRLRAVFCVMEEQERQWEEQQDNGSSSSYFTITDHQSLAQCYHQVTKKAQFAACLRGLCDELEAKQCNSSSSTNSTDAVCKAPQSQAHTFLALARQYAMDTDNKGLIDAAAINGSLTLLCPPTDHHNDHSSLSFTPIGGPAA